MEATATPEVMSTQEPATATKTLSAKTLAGLHKVTILASLKDEQLHCLDGAAELHLEPGATLVKQGEAARTFWILLSGAVRIVQLGPDGRQTLTHVMGEGGTFGEVPLLTNMPASYTYTADTDAEVLRLEEDQFWRLMTVCPEVRRAILENMAFRLGKMQTMSFQQEKMASLGTLAAGLMHELNNPGSAARRASSQLRENLKRMHALTAKWARQELSIEQKQCMLELQEFALSVKDTKPLSTLEQTDAEEALTDWMEREGIADAWRIAPTLVATGIHAEDLDCARTSLRGETFSDAINWLEAMVSNMQLVGTIEESIGRVTDLVHAVKSYAYEGRGQKQAIDINSSIHATLVILGHKFREKEIALKKEFGQELPALHTECQGLNQIWTNLLDNAIDAVPQGGTISIKTWVERMAGPDHTELCILIGDNGPGIPAECQMQVFDPFFTTKPVGVGTGLGLGIVYKIVEAFGGTIRFSSEPGDTEFLVRIPAREG